jgi:3',5'-cyclic AMP phosphodiesterase CpdA
MAAASFRLAHLADVHVFTWSALASWSLWEPKRLLGALNVALRRGPRAYDVRVLRAACGDARAHAHADHLLVAGDLTNLATAAEFALAARTLRDHYGACARTHRERETLVQTHAHTRVYVHTLGACRRAALRSRRVAARACRPCSGVDSPRQP